MLMLVMIGHRGRTGGRRVSGCVGDLMVGLRLVLCLKYMLL